MDIEKLKENVKNKLSKKRFEHVCRVEETSIQLANMYKINIEDARIAALLHDYMKETPITELKKICKNINEIKGYENLYEIFHGFAGAKIAETKFNIKNKDILNSIKYHTIGRENMSLLEKIIYIADAIEKGRNYPGVNEIRKKTFENINLGMLAEIDHKIKFLQKKDGIIHINTLKMKNSLIENLKNI